MTPRSIRPTFAGWLAAAAVLLSPGAPRAQMAVFDAGAYAQVLKQVQQSLQQVQALQQQVQQQAAMLRSLPTDVTAPLAAIDRQASALLAQAQGLGYSSSNIAQAFSTAYPTSLQGRSFGEVSAALTDWQSRTRQTLQEALAAQNQVASAQTTTAGAVSSAVAASQGAAGQTAAIQATNQLLAALSTQLGQLQTLMMTEARAAQSATAEQQSVAAAAQAESARALQYARPGSRLQNGDHL